MFLAFFYSLSIVKFSQVSLSLSHSHVDMAELACSAAINLFERFSTRLPFHNLFGHLVIILKQCFQILIRLSDHELNMEPDQCAIWFGR